MTERTRRARGDLPIDRVRARASSVASSPASAVGEHAEQEERVERTCIGCGKKADDAELIRLVLVESPDGAPHVIPDAKGGTAGRGAHVHPSSDCLALACKKGLSRAFKRELRAEPGALAASIRAVYARRLAGLLFGGVRSKLVVIGSDAVAEAIRTGGSQLILLAADSASAAMRSGVQRATAEGKTLVYGDKLQLARAIGRRAGEEREGVAVLSVTNVALATAIRRAWLCAVGLSPSTGGEGSQRGVEAVEDSLENSESEAR